MSNILEAPSVPAATFSPTIKLTADETKRLRRAADLEEKWSDLANEYSQNCLEERNRQALRALPSIPVDTPEKLPDAVMDLALGLALADSGVLRRIKPMLRDRVSEATEQVNDVLQKIQEQAASQAAARAQEVRQQEKELATSAGLPHVDSDVVRGLERAAADFRRGSGSARNTIARFGL